MTLARLGIATDIPLRVGTQNSCVKLEIAVQVVLEMTSEQVREASDLQAGKKDISFFFLFWEGGGCFFLANGVFR